jgi:iron complex outermembrane receptor protein
MFKRNKICTAALAALGGTLLVTSLPVLAQGQTVEITGSAIRRIEGEGALPVVVLRAEDIERQGVTSVVDLLQRLSAVQGGTVEANSVGGSTYGFSGVSIHNLGETRTLVLLNGHRLSQFGGQTLTGFAAGFDLNSIPVASIERVEVLTDGASALYGADAIAGVVNFITKRDSTDGEVSIGTSRPSGGAEEMRFSFTKGFGSLDKDGFNLMLTYGYDKRENLKAVERDYAKTGNLVFSKDGKTYRSQNYSPSPIPANVLDDNDNLISPYLIANGACPDSTFRVTDGSDDFCGYDYVSRLEIYPERTRSSGIASLTMAAGEHELFADLLLARTTQVSRIAEVPGGIAIPKTSEYYQQYLAPIGITRASTTAFYRVADLGQRTNDDQADFLDLALGSKGMVAGWFYDAAYTHSESKVEGSISGYPGALALANLRRTGLLNPFVLKGEQTPEAQAALDGVNYKGYWDGGVAKLDTLEVKASNEIAKLSAGSVQLAFGASWRKEDFESKPSPFAQGITTNPVTGELCDPNNPLKPCDQRFGDASAVPPYSASRDSYGLFGELNIPITKDLDTTVAARYDDYSDFGGKTTAKGSFRWVPSAGMLIRGSVGTGFHAPSVPQVNAAPQSYGVTEDPYDCTPELAAIAASLGAQCQPGKRQYDVLAGGNQELEPEESTQVSLGIRFEPSAGISLGADYWWVRIENAFGQLSEQTVFADPSKGAWTTATDVGTNTTYLAWNAGNLNLGKLYTSGIDFDLSGRFKSAWGSVYSQATATYMIDQDYQQERGGSYFSDLADNTNGALLYRWKGSWRTTLMTGNWAHTLGFNWVSGYTDAETTVEVLDASGLVTGVEDIRLKVKPFYTFDWQTLWSINKSFDLRVGLLNIFDKEPPLVLTTTGGQQVGYDGNLYDPRGRTIYADLKFKF